MIKEYMEPIKLSLDENRSMWLSNVDKITVDDLIRIMKHSDYLQKENHRLDNKFHDYLMDIAKLSRKQLKD